MKVHAGLRIGFWNPKPMFGHSPFTFAGYYTGPDLGDHVPGHVFEQQLMEGTVRFRLGVLFRHDLAKNQKLETILILVDYKDEMWEYDTWEQATG